MKKLLFCILMMLLPILASADPVEIEGVWYNLIPKAQIAEVTSNPSGDKYTGDVNILDKFTYDGVEYSVTKIRDNVFRENMGLTSVTIGNNVTSISGSAFYSCYGLKSVSIGKSIKSIGGSAFRYCSNLTSVHISDIKAWCEIDFYDSNSNPLTYAHHLYLNGEEIKDLIIPNSVESISGSAFCNCSSLNSVTIPNSVKSIGNGAFSGCSGLTSVYIPNSVESIGGYAFGRCSGLTSVNIPNSVTKIEMETFSGCKGLTSVTIGNSVESIAGRAFWGCVSLTSVAIPCSVTIIGGNTFGSCGQLKDVYCMPEQVRNNSNGGEGLYTNPYAFADSYQEYITLHVPAESAEAYRALEPWKSFKEIVGLNGEDIPEPPVTPKCATPTISLVDGKITFSCETEGVKYISNVSVCDAKDYYDNEISAPKKFKVTVCATKANYEISDTVTAEFDISGDTSLSGDVDGNGIVNVADHVKLSSIIMNK